MYKRQSDDPAAASFPESEAPSGRSLRRLNNGGHGQRQRYGPQYRGITVLATVYDVRSPPGQLRVSGSPCDVVTPTTWHVGLRLATKVEIDAEGLASLSATSCSQSPAVNTRGVNACRREIASSLN